MLENLPMAMVETAMIGVDSGGWSGAVAGSVAACGAAVAMIGGDSGGWSGAVAKSVGACGAAVVRVAVRARRRGRRQARCLSSIESR